MTLVKPTTPFCLLKKCKIEQARKTRKYLVMFHCCHLIRKKCNWQRGSRLEHKIPGQIASGFRGLSSTTTHLSKDVDHGASVKRLAGLYVPSSLRVHRHKSQEFYISCNLAVSHSRPMFFLSADSSVCVQVNDEGYTPLMEAAREGHEEMVALLLAQGKQALLQHLGNGNLMSNAIPVNSADLFEFVWPSSSLSLYLSAF